MDLDLDAIKEENIILEENKMTKEDKDVNMEKTLTIIFCIPEITFQITFYILGLNYLVIV